MPLFRFFRNRGPESEGTAALPLPAAETILLGPATGTSVLDAPSSPPLLASPRALPAIAGAAPLGGAGAGQALAAMLHAFDIYLPPTAPPLPAAGISLVSVAERSVGIGDRRGTALRGPFAIVALKGLRLDATIRFQLWAADATDAETAMAALHDLLQSDSGNLRAQGFLRLDIASSLPAEIASGTDWRKQADFRVLYEFPYEDNDGSTGLIARVPIHFEGEINEQTEVTDSMARWDNEAAPTLALRGPRKVKRLACLVYLPGALPAGSVSLVRTFEGAGAPTPQATLNDFLTAVSGPNPLDRNSSVSFADLADFFNAFLVEGTPVTLGDWDGDLLQDSYEARTLDFGQAIELASTLDRFEVTFDGALPDAIPFVAYLRSFES